MKKKQKEFSENLYLTPMNRVVLDNHSGETFGHEDQLICSLEDLTRGIDINLVLQRLLKNRKFMVRIQGGEISV